MHRILQFDNILNVRDYGGHSLAAGRKVVLGKLFRGAQLSTMSPADQRRFVDMDISLLIDLRYLSERQRQKTQLSSQFSPEIFEFETADAQIDTNDQADPNNQTDLNKLAPHEAFAMDELNTADDAKRYMLGSYADRPVNPGFVRLTARSLKRMAETGEGVYVHCAAGKDRTGTFAAILLLLLGATRDDVMDEYLRTRDAVDLDLIMPMIMKKMEKRYGRNFTAEILRPYFHVEPEYLERSLQVIGDVEKYAREILTLSPQDIDRLRAHYTQ